ncbi:MAG TPA: hypothetical protein VNZ26_21280 [Vicinamibacterales bacterium]|jgi:hypothetical protein|nr:hypothetical protein [Vicinamibacterales bacterium]
MLVAGQTRSLALVAALSSLGAPVVPANPASAAAPTRSMAPSIAARSLSPALTITIGLAVEADVSPKLIPLMTAETDEIWRQANMTFLWQRESPPASASARWMPASSSPHAELRVVVSNAVRSETERGLPLGWIAFDGPAAGGSGRAPVPEAEVYVSSASAFIMLNHAPEVVGHVNDMPLLERDTFVARAMGRALAHELGHYLLASKTHSAKGLMRAVYTAAELFGPARLGFTIDTAQRQEIADRLLIGRRVAGR